MGPYSGCAESQWPFQSSRGRAGGALRYDPSQGPSGTRTWVGARSQSVLMSVWRTCWQHRRSALDFLSDLLRGISVTLTLTA
jgi:hypothetical protein